ncbi:phage putative head morphogenesis protein, SPP1 gp7 family [Rosenbergiella nectarea]|uniref:Phage putative head morphogenesis protein, SPP1 gp7 family n=1 Tax=Rosenbergiella nectarea TaxID=988801 RepID=A0A1H9HPP3_9GAMM|nr:phage minor head protein [Rosenbergiella nectarea]SEQ64285.1 phage putative head morphogenesis protein, SPP1 gp7 family [Rosenbergiella nectarea]
MAKKRVWLHPDGVARDYQREILKATRQLNKEITSAYGDIRFDGWQDDLTGIINALEAFAKRIFNPVIEKLPSFFALTSQFNDRQWRIIVKGGTGVDIPASQAAIIGLTKAPASSGVLGVDAYRAERWLAEMQANWVAQNVALINSISADQLSDMEQIVRRGVMNGSASSVIKKQITDRYSVSESRAKLIAIDQIGKANAALTQQRQKDAGVDGYIWRGVLDQRERQIHIDREGKKYKWDSPPRDGHPGQPIRCRCYAEPDFSNSVFNID